MMKSHHRKLLSCGTALFVLAGSGAASAQTDSASGRPAAPNPPAGGAQGADGGIQDIIVTAEKRSTTVQRAPAAITAVTGTELAARGIQDLQRAQAIAPSVKLGQEGTSVQAFIRGVGIPLDTANIEPQVAINFNGMYIPREATGGANVFDVDRIEVLPGPQGTLYGRSATGGVINVNFRRPGKTLGGQIEGEYGNYNLYHLTGAIDLPASDTASFRLAANYNKRDGYMRSGSGEENDVGVRGSALLTPINRLTVFLWGSYISHHGSEPAAINYPRLNPSDPYDDTQPAGLQPFGPVNKGTKHQNVYFLGGQVDYEGDGFVITYLPSYVKVDARNTPWLAGFNAIASYRINQESNELKIATSGSGPLKLLGGLYQFDQTYHNYAFQLPFGKVYDQPLSKEYGVAAYAQATYAIIPKIRVTVGGRVSSTKRHAEANEFLGSGVPARPYSFAATYNRVDWKVGVDADVGPRSLAYATVQTGFNPGTYNANPSVPGLSLALKSTKLQSYTVGLKNRFASGRIQLNLEGFLYDYRDLLVSAENVLTGQQQTYNANRVQIYGAQIDTRFAPTSTTDLYTSVGLLHARNKDFVIAQVAGPPVDLNGLTPPYSPTFTINLGAAQTVPLASGAKLVARVDSHHESKAYAQFDHAYGTEIFPFWRTDISLTFTPQNDRFSLTGWVHNIENATVVTIAGSGGIPGPGVEVLERPRTYGVRASFNF